jgi:hypothetical protein
MKTEWVRGKNRERLFMKRTDGDRVRVYNKDFTYEGYVKPADPRFSRRADGEIVCRGTHPDLIHEHAERERREAAVQSRHTGNVSPRQSSNAYRPAFAPMERYVPLHPYEGSSLSGEFDFNILAALAPITIPLMLVGIVLMSIANFGLHILSLLIKGRWNP